MISLERGRLDLSVVVPVYDEFDNLAPLVEELRAVLESLRLSWEVLLVDDGSRDGSAEKIAELSRRDARVRSVLMRHHGGQSQALVAGLMRAEGAMIVTMDGDLQNDPADLPRLLAALDGADVVSGIRERRVDPLVRRWSSSVANVARRLVLGDSLTDIGCSLKAYRREALVGLPPFDGVHRFLPALCQLRGARVVERRVSHRPRRAGRSKYGISDRLWRGLRDLFGVRWLASRLISPPTRETDQP